jgi:hypothetical protein
MSTSLPQEIVARVEALGELQDRLTAKGGYDAEMLPQELPALKEQVAGLLAALQRLAESVGVRLLSKKVPIEAVTATSILGLWDLLDTKFEHYDTNLRRLSELSRCLERLYGLDRYYDAVATARAGRQLQKNLGRWYHLARRIDVQLVELENLIDVLVTRILGARPQTN